MIGEREEERTGRKDCAGAADIDNDGSMIHGWRVAIIVVKVER
jgi:hypothetical protein